MASEISVQSVSPEALMKGTQQLLRPTKSNDKSVSEGVHDSSPNSQAKEFLADKLADNLKKELSLSNENQKEKSLSMEELREMLDQINNTLYLQNRALKFQIHDKTEDLVVQVLNTKTDEVVRQYPSEEILALRGRLVEGNTESFSTQVF
ncbi:flagellar protein FlaG [Marinospirillum sp.]|uniref:flagellar protein FlaG n=1 Tax=Marinospirillum sp. TaxID=2183934 RepID=UPI00384DD90F